MLANKHIKRQSSFNHLIKYTISCEDCIVCYIKKRYSDRKKATRSQGHRGLPQGFWLNQRNNVAADTDCIIVRSLQTTFHIFSCFVDGALRLHVSARHTHRCTHILMPFITVNWPINSVHSVTRCVITRSYAASVCGTRAETRTVLARQTNWLSG